MIWLWIFLWLIGSVLYLVLGWHLGVWLVVTHKQHHWLPFLYYHDFSRTQELLVYLAMLFLWPAIGLVLLIIVLVIVAINNASAATSRKLNPSPPEPEPDEWTHEIIRKKDTEWKVEESWESNDGKQ